MLSRREKQLLTSTLLVIVVTLIFLSWQNYQRFFITTPAIGGRYTEALIGKPRFINPWLVQTNVDRDLTELIYAGLMRREKDLTVVPELAEAYTVSEDEKTYTFVLRPDLKWSDGQPLTMADIIFTFEKITDPNLKSPLEISWRGVEIKKIDEQTLELILAEPYAPFLNLLTVGILPRHVWGELTADEIKNSPFNTRPVSAGAWQVKETGLNPQGGVSDFTLIPNNYYQRAKPFLTELNFKLYGTIEEAIKAVKRKEVDGLSHLPKEYENVFADRKHLRHLTLNIPRYTALFFNQNNQPALKNLVLRQALSLSIDKNFILKEALDNQGAAINGSILPGSIGYYPELATTPFDLVKASELLDQAGWQPITTDTYLALSKIADATADSLGKAVEGATADLSDKDKADATAKSSDEAILISEPLLPYYRLAKDQILTLTITTIDQQPLIETAEIIKKFWEAIGIKVNLQIVDRNVLQKEVLRTRDYEILLFSVLVGADTDPFAFWHSSQVRYPGVNLAMLENKEVDGLLETARQTSQIETRVEKYRRFQEIVAAELPAIFLYSPTYLYVVDDKLMGLELTNIILPSDRFLSVNEWYRRARWQFK